MPICRSNSVLRWRCKWPKSAGKWKFLVHRHPKTCVGQLSLIPTSALYIRWWAHVRWQVNQDGGRMEKRFPPAETFYCDNWHKRAGRTTRIFVHWGQNFRPIQFLGTNLNPSTWMRHPKPQPIWQDYVHSKVHVILVSLHTPNVLGSASLLGLLAKIKV